MSSRNLKSLDWKAIFNKPSDDEYDSDETLCEEGLGVNVNRKYFQADCSLSTTNKSELAPSTELKRLEKGSNMFLNTNSMSKESEICSNNYSDHDGFKNVGTNIEVSKRNITHRNWNPSPSEKSPDAIENCNNCNDDSESTFGFTNMPLEMLHSKNNHINVIGSDYPGVTGECSKLNHTISGSLFGYSDKLADCTEKVLSGSEVNKEEDQRPLKKEYFIDSFQEKEKTSNEPLKEAAYFVDHSCNQDISYNCQMKTQSDSQNINHSSESQCNGMKLDSNNSFLQTDNCLLNISTETLGNLLDSDFIREIVEDEDDLRKKICSPPLTLLEKTLKQNTCPGNKLKNKKKKPEKDIAKKILPPRRCSSKYIDKSKRFSESEETPGTESIVFTNTNANGIKTKGRKSTRNITYRTMKKKSKKSELKPFPGKKSSWIDKTMKEKLKEVDQALHQIEEKVDKWMNGNGESIVTRNQALEMLMETQGMVKILESLQVPKRSKRRIGEFKIQLSNRAKKLASVIDKAIVESDKMLTRECYEKLSIEKFTEDDPEKSKITAIQKQNIVKHKKFPICHDLSENSFYHYNDENSKERNAAMQQGTLKNKNDNVQFTNNDESVERMLIQRSNPNIIQEKSNVNEIDQQGLINKPKSILKYSSSENSAENYTSARKHITFSDEVELCYLSDSTPTSFSGSEPILSHSQSSFETNRNVANICVTEHKTNTLAQFPNSNVISNNSFKDKANEASVQVEEICSKPKQKLSNKSSSDKHYVQESAETIGLENSVLLAKGSQKPPCDFEFSKLSDVTLLKKSGYRNVCVEEPEDSKEENVLKHSPTNTFSLSESSGYGFSEESINTDQPVWGDVSVLDIKYIRIKSPSEFTPAEEDDRKWLEDFDKW